MGVRSVGAPAPNARESCRETRASRRDAAFLPGLRERADRGGGAALPPLRLQHLPLRAQRHPQGGPRPAARRAQRGGRP